MGVTNLHTSDQHSATLLPDGGPRRFAQGCTFDARLSASLDWIAFEKMKTTKVEFDKQQLFIHMNHTRSHASAYALPHRCAIAVRSASLGWPALGPDRIFPASVCFNLKYSRACVL